MAREVDRTGAGENRARAVTEDEYQEAQGVVPMRDLRVVLPSHRDNPEARVYRLEHKPTNASFSYEVEDGDDLGEVRRWALVQLGARVLARQASEREALEARMKRAQERRN